MTDSGNLTEPSEERSWPARIALQYPITFGSQTIPELTFRRGRLGDLKGVRLDGIPPVDQLVLIISRMCGQPTQVIDLLDAEDAGEVMQLAMDFFARCLVTGRTA